MQLVIGTVIALLSPALSLAGVAGDWVGTLSTPHDSHRVVLHITGPDNDLKATNDSPDQKVFGVPVPSIVLSGSTLQYSIPLIGVKFSGDVLPDDTIAGTFTQHGTGLPLVLARTATPPKPAVSTQPGGVVTDGHYHHNATGVEFDLPSGWLVNLTRPRDGDPSILTVLRDTDHKLIVATVDMRTGGVASANMDAALSQAIPMLVGRRAGQTGQAAPHLAQNYKIREGSVEKTLIGGSPAQRAIADYQENGAPVVELLTWIYTQHTRTFFLAKMPAANLSAVQPAFDRLVESARIP
jgi:hypothetical protein